MAREVITKYEIINEKGMYTVSTNADGKISCLKDGSVRRTGDVRPLASLRDSPQLDSCYYGEE
jgi:hypothetical protein